MRIQSGIHDLEVKVSRGTEESGFYRFAKRVLPTERERSDIESDVFYSIVFLTDEQTLGVVTLAYLTDHNWWSER